MKRKVLSLLLIAVLVTCLFSACSAGSADTAYAEYETTMAVAEYRETDDSLSEAKDIITVGHVDLTSEESLYTPQDDRKMIRTAELTVESENYEASVQAIQAKIEATGAYIEASSADGSSEYCSRYSMISIRVPADRFAEFMAAADSFGVVTSSSVRQEDVTLSYTDNEARLETLNTKKERLLALLEEATKMADIIELENALAETVAEIETYTAELNHLDNLIAYCTVNIELQEVYHATPVVTTPKTLWERIGQRFAESVENLREGGEELLIFLLGNSPILLIPTVILLAVILLCVRSSRRRKAARKAAEEESQSRE